MYTPIRSRRCRVPMVVEFTTTYAIGAYLHWCARYTTLCDKVCQWQVGGFLRVLRFPPPINWPPRYNWTEILLKVALITINQSTNHIPIVLERFMTGGTERRCVRLYSSIFCFSFHFILIDCCLTSLWQLFIWRAIF